VARHDADDHSGLAASELPAHDHSEAAEAGLIAALEVSGFVYDGAGSPLTGTLTTIVTFNLNIPASWNTWDAVVQCSYTPIHQTAASPARSSYECFVQIDNAGANSKFASVDNNFIYGDGFTMTAVSGRTNTGSVAVDFRARETAGGINMEDIFLYARAVRTS
jgi:hypothetical protein